MSEAPRRRVSALPRSSRRDFRAELEQERCWDREAQTLYETVGIPLVDAILQNREELIALCEWMDQRQIRRYVEVGVWTGRMISALHRIFDFDLVAACDLGYAEDLGLPLRLPFGTRFLRASSHSGEYVAWRRALGPVDLVFIDGDHSYEAVRADFEINRELPHRWLAFHDITGNDPNSEGSRRLWRELTGDKYEILRPHRELGREGSQMGIGLWRAAAD